MKRREFIVLTCGVTAWPLTVRAQQRERMRRVGVLMIQAADHPIGQARAKAFQRSLQQLGWTDGRNVQTNYRWAAGNVENARKYAAELVALAPDVILVQGAATGPLRVPFLATTSPQQVANAVALGVTSNEASADKTGKMSQNIVVSWLRAAHAM
jgi:putative ABC transport system substrate-binding protein